MAQAETPFDPFSYVAPWHRPSTVSGWEPESLNGLETAQEKTEGAEAARKPVSLAEDSTEPLQLSVSAEWQDMTSCPMDWQRHMISQGIPAPAKVLGVAMSHYCGPNSHGCSASIGTLAEKANMSRSSVDRAVKALRGADLIRESGKGMAGNKVYRLGIPG
jgi:DNA-binding transcriptional ArsR family regulator